MKEHSVKEEIALKIANAFTKIWNKRKKGN
jgi:hypothetical protein